jgi:hypothetical protein
MFPVVVIPERRFFASSLIFYNLYIRIVFTGGDNTAPVGAPKPAKAGSTQKADDMDTAAQIEIAVVLSLSSNKVLSSLLSSLLVLDNVIGSASSLI